MEDKKINLEAINNVYKNAHIALQSISNVSPETADLNLKEELLHEYEGYEKIIGEISAFMKSKDWQPKDVNPLKKAMLWTSIKLNALKGDDTSHIAEMMIKGSVMGITELTQMINADNGVLDEEVLNFAKRLKDLEEEYVERLKQHL